MRRCPPQPQMGALAPVLVQHGDVSINQAECGNGLIMVGSTYGATVQRLTGRRLDETVAAFAHNATALRGAFRRWVDSFLDEDAADDLTLAVYEALANAVDHAFTGNRVPGVVRLRAHVTGGEIIITVSDNGRWRSRTDSGGYRGRGLALIHQLATEVQVAPSPYGTTVCLRHQLHAGHDREVYLAS